jgi:hypothetical protein
MWKKKSFRHSLGWIGICSCMEKSWRPVGGNRGDRVKQSAILDLLRSNLPCHP